METQRWRKIRELLEQAVDMSPPEREKLLSQSCGDDAAMRAEVQSLLIGCDDAPSFLDASVVDVFSEIIGSQEAPSLVGQHVGPYRLVRYIASGGMGAVYLATSPDSLHKKEVAVKLIRRRTITPDTLRRFRIERQALAALHHPHIAALLDGGLTDAGLPYLVMEYIDGPPLDKYCDEKLLSTNERLELFRGVCAGVAYAHRNLIVHRDLKPNNILVTSQGVPKLLDFGIAKVLDPRAADQPAETTTRNRILTPEYASPEHIRGDAITTASDVYSLGVILFGLLTGHCPYRFKSRIPHEIERTICEQDPEKPSTAILRRLEALSPDEGPRSTSTPESLSKLRAVTPAGLRRQLSGDLDAIILMSLRKEPHRRYSSVEQFSDDIQCHLQGLPVTARIDSTGYRLSKFVRRNRIMVTAAIVTALSLIAGLTMTIRQSRVAIRAQLVAESEAVKAAQVNDFLQGMLTGVDPHAARGGNATIRQMLDNASFRLASGALKNQPEVRASVHLALSKTYYELGAYEQAEKHVSAALKIRSELFGAIHPDVAECLNNLGILAKARGNYDEAEQYYRDALEMRRAALGRTHPDVAESMNDLGVLLKTKGQLSQAESLLREALEIRRPAFSRHPELVATTKANLAAVLKHKREYQEAEALYREALEIYREVLGPKHLRVAVCLNNLALLLRDTDNLDGAEPLFREALAVRREVFSGEHPAVATGLHNLALLLGLRGHVVEAETLYREALAMRRNLLGDDHPRVANTANNLAKLLASIGDFAEARELAQIALAIRREKLPADHPRIAISLHVLGEILVGLEDPGGAEPLLRESVAILQEKLPPEDRRVLSGQLDLGSCLTKLDEFAEAEEVLTAVHELIRDDGTSATMMTDLRKRLVKLYQAWGKTEEANRYRDTPGSF